MIWIVIIVVLALVIGPALYLLPSARDKRLVELRKQARSHDMSVEITSVPKLDPLAEDRVSAGGVRRQPSVDCAAYRISTGGTLPWPDLLVLRLPAQPTVPVQEVMPGWAVTAQSRAGWDAFTREPRRREGLQAALSAFPEDSLACGVGDRFIACYWRERADPASNAVAEIADSLRQLRAALDADLRPAGPDG